MRKIISIWPVAQVTVASSTKHLKDNYYHHVRNFSVSFAIFGITKRSNGRHPHSPVWHISFERLLCSIFRLVFYCILYTSIRIHITFFKIRIRSINASRIWYHFQAHVRRYFLSFLSIIFLSFFCHRISLLSF